MRNADPDYDLGGPGILLNEPIPLDADNVNEATRKQGALHDLVHDSSSVYRVGDRKCSESSSIGLTCLIKRPLLFLNPSRLRAWIKSLSVGASPTL